MKSIRTIKITRKLKYLDIPNEIYNEEYHKEVTLFGMFKITREFHLENDITPSNKDSQIGFKK